jgi:hypothetical protein
VPKSNHLFVFFSDNQFPYFYGQFDLAVTTTLLLDFFLTAMIEQG